MIRKHNKEIKKIYKNFRGNTAPIIRKTIKIKKFKYMILLFFLKQCKI